LFFLIITALAGLVCLWAILWPQSSLLYPVVTKGDRSSKQIALTFDDGPHPEFTPAVLDVLREFRIKATFFCLGRQVEAYPEVVTRIHNEGHLIGSHSYDHSFRFFFSGFRFVHRAIVRSEKSVQQLTGYFPRFYRPPVGIKTPPQCISAWRIGLRMISWSRRAFDGSYATLNEKKIENLMRRIQGGDIVLLHDGRITPAGKEFSIGGLKQPLTLHLKSLLERLLAAGYQPVRVDELLQEPFALQNVETESKSRAGLLKKLRQLLLEYSDPWKLSLAVAAGVFIGCSPLFGLHALLGFLAAVKFRLNKVAVIAGTSISNPFVAPFLTFASVQIGWRCLYGSWLNIQPGMFSEESNILRSADRFFFSWMVGFVILGTALALVAGFLTFLSAKAGDALRRAA
jgi:peptidoglycan/xylan/chitin deacetylase (PgdA/CDA1 family)/uncharacterized protein (DUF2062 family)